MTSMARPVTSSVYAVVLRKDLPSPVAPESDEAADADVKKPDAAGDTKDAKPDAAATAKKNDKPDDKKNAKKDDTKDEKKPVEPVRIEFDGLDQRTVALPIERRNYIDLEAGPEGALLLVANPIVLSDEDYSDLEQAPPQDVYRYDPKTRKAERLLENIDGGTAVYGGCRTFVLSGDGTKMLFAQGKKWFVAPSDKAPKRRRGRAAGRHRGVCGSARRVEPDVPRGLANRARLPLRAELPRARLGRGRAGLRRRSCRALPAERTSTICSAR